MHVLLAATALAACAPSPPSRTPVEAAREVVVPEPRSAVVEPPPSSPRHLGLRACALGRLDVDFARLRAWKRGDWLAQMLRADPRFGELAVPGKVEPFRDAERARFCAETYRGGDWDAVVMRHALEEPVLLDAIRVYSTRVDRGGPEDLGVPSVAASRLRIGTAVWSSLRVRPGEVLFVTPDAARESASLYASAPEETVLRDLGDDLAAIVDVVAPGDRFPRAGPEIAGLTSLHVELRAMPDGAADLRAWGQAPSEAVARELASAMTARAEEASRSFLARMLLRDLLAGFTAKPNGRRVEVHLPASPPQVDSLLSLLSAELGVRLDASRPADAPRAATR